MYEVSLYKCGLVYKQGRLYTRCLFIRTWLFYKPCVNVGGAQEGGKIVETCKVSRKYPHAGQLQRHGIVILSWEGKGNPNLQTLVTTKPKNL